MNADNMIPMRNADREKFALLYEPGHPQHGWIFYDNYGRWAALRRASEVEVRRAKDFQKGVKWVREHIQDASRDRMLKPSQVAIDVVELDRLRAAAAWAEKHCKSDA